MAKSRLKKPFKPSKIHYFTAVAVVAVTALIFTTVRFVTHASSGWTTTYDSTDSSTAGSEILTAEGTDNYLTTLLLGGAVMKAPPTNTGGNLRVAFWPSDSPQTTDQRSCATWTSETQIHDQEGIALRISGNKLLTVTKNIWAGATWFFNVHTWDTTKSPAFTQIGQKDMSAVVRPDGVNMVPFPWHVCAQVQGTQFQYKVWTGDNPEPAWGDPNFGDTVTVPSDYVYPGKTGWYIGHLLANDATQYDGLSTASFNGTKSQ